MTVLLDLALVAVPAVVMVVAAQTLDQIRVVREVAVAADCREAVAPAMRAAIRTAAFAYVAELQSFRNELKDELS
jgi:hypothetical protein